MYAQRATMDRAPACASKVCHRRVEQRRHDQHMVRIRNMKSQIDTSEPMANRLDHVRQNLKKEQQLEERYSEIDRTNRILLKRMSDIMRGQPGAEQGNRLGPVTLNSASRRRELLRISKDNQNILRRIQDAQPVYSQAKWDVDYERHVEYAKRAAEYPMVLRHPRRNMNSACLQPIGDDVWRHESGAMTERAHHRRALDDDCDNQRERIDNGSAGSQTPPGVRGFKPPSPTLQALPAAVAALPLVQAWPSARGSNPSSPSSKPVEEKVASQRSGSTQEKVASQRSGSTQAVMRQASIALLEAVRAKKVDSLASAIHAARLAGVDASELSRAEAVLRSVETTREAQSSQAAQDAEAEAVAEDLTPTACYGEERSSSSASEPLRVFELTGRSTGSAASVDAEIDLSGPDVKFRLRGLTPTLGEDLPMTVYSFGASQSSGFAREGT